MAGQAAQFVGSIPENYDRALGPHIFIGYAEELGRRVAALRPGSVLELAAGTGISTREIRNTLSPEAVLIASDLNAPMLNVARGKFGAAEKIEFREIDAMEIDVPAESFDVVACQFGVMFFPDKERSHREVLRALRPGGTYIFSVWDDWDRNPFARIAHETVESAFPDDPPGFYRVPFGYNDEAEIRKTLESAGFEDISVEPLPLTSDIPDPAKFAHGLVFGNPLLDEIINRGGDPDAVFADMTEAVAARLGNKMPLQAIFVTARKL